MSPAVRGQGVRVNGSSRHDARQLFDPMRAGQARPDRFLPDRFQDVSASRKLPKSVARANAAIDPLPHAPVIRRHNITFARTSDAMRHREMVVRMDRVGRMVVVVAAAMIGNSDRADIRAGARHELQSMK